VYGDAAPGAPAAPVNINTAPREVLEALDERISPELAKRIAEYRRLSPFKHPAELAQVAGMESIAPALLSSITTKGWVYRLRSDAMVNGSTRTVEAVVRLTGGSSIVLYWREF
jgi:general secretion pathway protein K